MSVRRSTTTPRKAPANGSQLRRGDNRFKPPKYRIGPKAVGSFIPTVTKSVFEKYGFSTASLITDWAAIVGKELAAYTIPEKMNWPRGVDIYASGTNTSSAGATGNKTASRKADKTRQGATLVLRVDGPRAVEIPYKAAQIIERINAYFGYAAISEMRIVQAPFSAITPKDVAKYEKLEAPVDPPALVANVEDDSLRGALAKMSVGLARRKNRLNHS